MAGENRKKLTHKGLEREKPAPKGKRVEIWDKECPGFGVRITDKGVKSFQVFYRHNGQQRRKGLGRFGVEGSLSKARNRAREIIEAARAGTDPEIKERLERAKQARAEASTFASVRAKFIEEYAKPRNRTWRAVERYFERDLSAWDPLPISAITDADIIEAIDRKRAAAGPYAANRLFAHIRKLFRWAASKRLIASSPVIDIEKPGEEQERARTLTVAEIKILWGTFENLGWPFGPMLRLLLATAQRRSEVAGMHWSEIQPIAAADSATLSHTPINWIWTIPGERTKNGRAHVVPLSPLAREVLAALPRFTSDFVFPARDNHESHASGFGKAKERADRLSGLTDWRFHDLRRTVATVLGELGQSLVVPRVLNHTDSSVTGKHYNKYDFLPEKRHALETWARKLETIIRPTPENVVNLRA